MSTTQRQQTIKAIAIASALAVALLLYGFVDPATNLFPRCIFKSITGYECPGCGSQRAIHALLTGQLSAAWHYNPLFVVALPFVVLLFVADRLKYRHPRLHNALNSRIVIIVCGVVVIGWWIIRNQ